MIKRLRLVEIELFSYCNRKCNWCPNREIDRNSQNIEIEDGVLNKLLKELKESEYNGAITFSRFNEPMSHIEIFKKRVFQIREIFPNNKLITNTNGDFVTKENLEGLLLDELTIMDYDRLGIENCVERLELANAEIDEIVYPYIYAHKENMKILYFVDWLEKKTITDRGGFLKEFSQVKREVACYEPKYFIGVNYDGTISPCCNIRNDIDNLKPFIMGDLHYLTLNEILESQKHSLFQSNCENAIFDENSPCYYCSNQGGRYTKGKNGIKYE